MDLVTIASFNEIRPALQLQSLLKDAGIESEIQEHHWFSTENIGKFKLKIRHDKWDHVKPLLDSWDNQPLNEAVHCPECNSLRIQYPQLSRKFITPSIVATFIPFLKWKFYCQDCHCLWSPHDDKENLRKVPLVKAVIKPVSS
jgi:hypothetical protein